jgi:hypothetical protein
VRKIRACLDGRVGERHAAWSLGVWLLPVAVAGGLGACSSGASSPSSTALPTSASTGGGGMVSSVAEPVFGPTVVAAVPPPPISGGTLLATHDGTRVIAADPERDSVYVVNLATSAVESTIALTAGDEPGRLVEDGAGRVHVALRSGGALATIDPAKGTILERRAVCAAPRGVAYDSATDLVWVACATGELVGLPAAGGPAAHTFAIERDLRDVIVGNGSLSVTKFRSAEVLRITSGGAIARRDALPSPQPSFLPHVAWRTVAGPSGTVIAVHQAESTTSVQTQVQGGYGGGGSICGGSSGGQGGFIGVGSSLGTVSVPPPPLSPGDDSGVFSTISGDDAAPLAFGDDAAPLAFGDDAANVDSAEDAVAPTVVQDAGAATFASDASTSTVPTEIASNEGGLPGLLPTPVPSQGSSNTCIGASDGGLPPGYLSRQSSRQGGCVPTGIVLDVLSALGADGSVLFNLPFPGVLPVDVAVSPDGSTIAAVAPGNAFTSDLDTVFVFTTCGVQQQSTPILATDGTSEQPVAVTFSGDRLIVQVREPSELRIFDTTGASTAVALSKVSREDTGHDVFHTQAGGMIACGSCHPEGREDGHVWILDGGHRRTPSLQGTIAGTAPYHWPGDEADLNVLVNDVYTIRMSGAMLPDDQRNALTGWVQTVPPPAPASTSSASQRGKTLFERADVGCAGCHSGPKFTNNKTVDVGTGGAFQVPPLVGVAWRTPLMHDGCAATIADRFGACSTPAHGSIGSLSASDISDLVSYLETL